MFLWVKSLKGEEFEGWQVYMVKVPTFKPANL